MPRRPRMRSSGGRLLRSAIIALCLAAASWLGGLFWFVSQVPSPAPPVADRTDAIVVLTGGSERLDTGLRLLAEGFAAKLFVSGAAPGVDLAALLRVARRPPKKLACCIAIGYRADNTAGNARETSEWMHEQGFTSLRLVTAAYHMPRSLLEFRRAMADTVIIPHPVFPPRFKREQWWLWPGTASLLTSEYNKHLVARLWPSAGAGAGAGTGKAGGGRAK